TPVGNEEPQGDCRIPTPQRPADHAGLDEVRTRPMTVSLLDISTYLPGAPVSADYYAGHAETDELRENVMFKAPKFRHHVDKDETAIDMVERAAAGLVERHGQDTIANIDILITHVQL